jgi:uncharacterized protein
MNNGPSYFEIQADDTARAIDFYTQVFGWQFTRAKGIPIPYWRITTSTSNGGLMQRPTAKPPGQSGTNAYCCSMETNNFDATSEKIVKAGGVVAMAKFAVPGTCWQGYFLDTEGNVFGIFQVDEGAGK